MSSAMHSPTSFRGQPQTVSGEGCITGSHKNELINKIIPEIEAVGKLISYAKALDMLIESARARGDDDDWDELAEKSKEAWAEIKRRNMMQKEALEQILGQAIGDRMEFDRGAYSPRQNHDEFENEY